MNNLISMMHEVLNGNEQALKELDDIFEENELSRCERSFVLYYCVCEHNQREEEIEIIEKRFSSQEARNAFEDGLFIMNFGQFVGLYIYCGNTKEEVIQKIK